MATASEANTGRILAERPSPRDGRDRGGRAAARTVTVNLAESPLGWLRARGLLSARQFDAGEQLRTDYERAALAPGVTMRWDAAMAGGGRRGARVDYDPTAAQLSAKRRFDAAVAHAGPGLSDILWRVVCACEAIPAAEKGLGWPARSGRLVLTLALDRLADFYVL